MRATIILCLALMLSLSARGEDAALEDYQATLSDTVLYIKVTRVGTRLERVLLTDGADSRSWLSIEGGFTREQMITYSVHGERDFLAQVWAADERLAVVKAQAMDAPIGKGWRLTYSDGTVIEIVA